MRRLTIGVAALLLFAACGDGDAGETSLEEYFADLEVAAVAYDAAAGPIDTALSESTDPLNDVKELFPPFVDDLGAFVDALAGMTPPSEVSAEHAITVDRGRAVFAAFEDVVAELDGVNDLEGLSALFAGPAMAAMIEAGHLFSEGCETLQSVADAEGIAVDLRCD